MLLTRDCITGVQELLKIIVDKTAEDKRVLPREVAATAVKVHTQSFLLICNVYIPVLLPW